MHSRTPRRRARNEARLCALGLALALFGACALVGKAQAQSLWQRDDLTGDWGGARKQLSDRGVTIGIVGMDEVFGNLSGGVRRGATYDGRLDVTIGTDLGTLAGWTGASTQVRAFQIHTSDHTIGEDVGALADPSSIDALATTRLFTLWFQQDFGKLASLRVGQLAADDEFMISNTAAALVNSTFGWPVLFSADLPAGGPAYPLATPGLRLQVNPTDEISLLAGLFSGDPAGSGCTRNPQACDRYGTEFSFSGGAFWIGELQYSINQGADATGLAASYKFGGWFHSGDFADVEYGIGADGRRVSLASVPTPAPLEHDGDWQLYGLVDQMVWRDAGKSVSAFVRGGFGPADRNLVSWYVDGGVGLGGFVAGRPNDTLTFGAAYSKISPDAAALDRARRAMDGAPYPIRDGEAVFELTYAAAIAPWWSVQPDLQYIVNPGGNVPQPNDSGRALGNAFIIGVRSTVTF